VSTLEISLDLGDVGAFSVVSCTVSEGISELTLAEVEIASREDLDFHALLEQDAVITLLYDGFEVRRWTLKVGRAIFDRVESGSLRYKLDLHPHFWLLRHTISTRKFRNMSTEKIISRVLGEHQVEHRFALTRDTREREYLVQYRETALAFVSRLLEFEGIYYTFDPDGTLVFNDRSSASPPVEGKSFFELIDSAGALAHGEMGVTWLARAAHVTSGAATVNDFNWKTPKTNLLKTKKADLDSDLEIYDYPVGYREPGEGDMLAQIRLEALRVPAKQIEGKSNVAAFAPARLIELGPLHGLQFAGEHLLIHVRHTVRNAAFLRDGDELYENEFRTIPRGVPFRAPVVTPYPVVQGCHTAMVRGPSGEEIHTDKFGRFRAQFHWDREAKGTDDDSRWVRMCQETVTGQVLARVGWEMHVAYIDGDPDRPIGIARNINGEMVPAYSQPAEKTKFTIKTLTYPGGGGFNELRFEDLAGSQHFDWKAERDLVNLVKRNKTETIGGNETHKVDGYFQHNVEHDQTRHVAGDDKLTVEESYQLHVTGDRTMDVGGDEKITVDVAHSNAVAGDDKETVNGDRSTTVDDASITHASVKTTSRTIGGDFIIKANGNIQFQCGRELTEKISGDKTTTSSEGGILQTCSGTVEIDIRGDVTKKAKDDINASSHESEIEVGADATMESQLRYELRSDTIEIDCSSKLTITGAGTTIELTPDEISVTGPLKLEAGCNIRVTGNPDNLTS
jgi:type VI secretion system secreted protein VgrG